MARRDLDEADDGRSSRVAPGDLVVVRLAETPSSGYRWQIEPVDPAVLIPAGDDFESPGGARGGGGTRQLRFTVVGTGTTVVRLALRRGWQAAAPAQRRYEVTIHAAADPPG